jgi:hypothetical protein
MACLPGQTLGPADEILDRGEDEAGDEQSGHGAGQGDEQSEETIGPGFGASVDQGYLSSQDVGQESQSSKYKWNKYVEAEEVMFHDLDNQGVR